MDFENLLEQLQEKQELEETRKRGPFTVPSSGDDPTTFTPSHVFAILTCPIYAGVGPYPPIISDENWIKLQCKLIERYGPELVFRAQLDGLRSALPAEITYDGV